MAPVKPWCQSCCLDLYKIWCFWNVSSEQRKSVLRVLKGITSQNKSCIFLQYFVSYHNIIEKSVAFSVAKKLLQLWSRRAALISFHLVVFRSVDKTQDNTLVWGGIKVWKKSIYEEKHGEKDNRWETRKILSFFFSKWDQTQHPLFAFFPFHFEQRLQQTDIIRACCIGFDTKYKNFYHQL